MNQCGASGFLQIEDYGLIGDMHTCALVGKNGSLDFMCWPDFDSPSIFCRMLDRKGGLWSINPSFAQDDHTAPISKQQYVASSNLLHTKWIHETGVLHLVDFFALSKYGEQINPNGKHIPATQNQKSSSILIRKLECLRGEMDVHVEIDPRPDYARGTYHFRPKGVRQIDGTNLCQSVTFDPNEDDLPAVHAMFEKTAGNEKTGIFKPLKSGGVSADLHLVGGQTVFFLMAADQLSNNNSNLAANGDNENMPNHALEVLKSASYHETQTKNYWKTWARKCHYRGRFQQEVERSLLLLKLLTYKPSGAIVAAPTFSLPEAIGGSRNWDYRYSWVRDSSFTVYVFLKMGFVDEAEAYINFIFDRIEDWHQEGVKKHLPLMFSITGESDLPELVLEHLGGYKDTKPVRIGNAATGHVQLDIYGELMDAIYLYNKHGKPITYDQWVSIRHLINYVSTVWSEPDMSIWEVRGKKEHFVYSKMMLWVAFDRALRLAEKRCLPCPDRNKWMVIRDSIYEEVMTEGYNQSLKSFVQSYESGVLDAAVLVAPLVFFCSPNDNRFLSTLDRILKSPEKGGLTSAGMVFRYDHSKTDDGVGGREGTFIMCTFWLIEALIRASVYDGKTKTYLDKAISLFEGVMSFSNHLGMFSEEIAISGEQLGNTPQAFSHLAFVSAAYNLHRVTDG